MDDNKLIALTSLDLKFNDVKDFKYIFPWVNTDLTLKKDHRVISYSLDARDMNNLNKFVKDFMISFNGDFYLLFDQIHNTNYKNKWEVVLKYWFQIFLTNFFHNYIFIEKFSLKYNTSNIKINLFNKNKFNIFFKNTWEFSYFVQKHEYNHILLSKLLNIFSIVDKNSPSYNFSISNPFKYSIRKKIKDFFKFLLDKINIKNDFFIADDDYFENTLKNDIAFLNPKKYFFINKRNYRININLRKEIKIQLNKNVFKKKIIRSFFKNNDCLINLFLDYLTKSIPKEFLENFNSNSIKLKKNFNSNKFFLTFHGFAYNDDLKILKMIIPSLKIIGLQHGFPGYFRDIPQRHMDIEKFYDFFGVTGYENKQKNFFNIPFYSGLKFKNLSYKKNGNILLCLGEEPLYSLHAGSPESGVFFNSIKEIDKFIETLPIDLFQKLIVRAYPNHDVFKQEKYFTNKYPNIKFSKNKDIVEDVISSKIIVNTNLNSTFIHSYMTNIPVISFWPNNVFKTKLELNQIISQLEKENSHFNNGEDASKRVINIYTNLEYYKLTKTVKTIRNFFCGMQCNNSNLINTIKRLKKND